MALPPWPCIAVLQERLLHSATSEQGGSGSPSFRAGVQGIGAAHLTAHTPSTVSVHPPSRGMSDDDGAQHFTITTT